MVIFDFWFLASRRQLKKTSLRMVH